MAKKSAETKFPEKKSSEKKTSTMAILALVFGIIFAPLGIVFGFVALHELKRDPHLSGKGLAIAGLVLGIVGTILLIAAVVLIIAVFGFVSQFA